MDASGSKDGGAVGFREKVFAEHFMRRTEATEILVQTTDPLGKVMDEVEVVRNKNTGEFKRGVKLVEEELQFLRPPSVNAGRRLVKQEELWLLQQSRGDEHPLKLASRQGAELAVRKVCHAQPLQCLHDARPPTAGHSAKPE